MDDFTRALAHGEAGLNKINAGMSGNLGASAAWAAIEDATEDRQPVYRPRPQPWGNSGYLRFRAVLVVFCILVLAALIVFR